VAFQVAIKQQKEFEEALKRAQDKREAEASAERVQAEAQKRAARSEAIAASESSSVNLDAGTESVAEPKESSDARGASVDVEV